MPLIRIETSIAAPAAVCFDVMRDAGLHARPWLFEDVMVRGAFASFKHVHRFEAIAEGTRMIDEFDYRSPLGLLGRLADALFLKRYMRELLRSRASFLKTAAEEARSS